MRLGKRRLPTPTERFIEDDEIDRSAGLALCQIAFGVEQVSLHGEHVKKIDRPLAIALLRDPERDLFR